AEDFDVYVWRALQIQGDFTGMLMAPEANIIVDSDVTFQGCAQGRQVTFRPGAAHLSPLPDEPTFGRRASIEVELSLADAPACPPAVRLRFPEAHLQGRDVAAAEVELGPPVQSANGCVYSDVLQSWPLGVCDAGDHPCVNHPDQWDEVQIQVSAGAGADGIRLTQFLRNVGDTAPGVFGYYNFVFTANTDVRAADPVSGGQVGLYPLTLAVHGYDYDPSNGASPQRTLNQLVNGYLVLPPGQWYSLKEMIAWRRQAVAEQVIADAYNGRRAATPAPRPPSLSVDDVDLDAFPRTVREASRDHGQIGDAKYIGEAGVAQGRVAACAGTQAFYQLNYARDYWDELPRFVNGQPQYECFWDDTSPYCQVINGAWPNPTGTLRSWMTPSNSRALARLHLDSSRTGLDDPNFIRVVSA
ncbi:MAG: hypothetical protein P8099_21005, partial [Gemmatimonadota bacterium]